MGVWYGVVYELKNKVPDGEYLIYYNDILKTKAFMRNHLKDSVWTDYFENGKPRILTTYKNGLIDGPLTEFNGENGKIWAIYHYREGKLIKVEKSPGN